MINVNKLTSMLAKMQDPQLQQYAQMHKNDPYIVSLVMSESNRRKEVRAAAPQMAEQPKVVDQEIAQIAPQRLPEDQGIGQIPAGNMDFANGGIIAFADGGDVERYQSRGLVGPYTSSLTGDIPGFVAGSGNFVPQAGDPSQTPPLRRFMQSLRDEGRQYQIAQAQARIASGNGTAADQAILADAAATSTAVPFERPAGLPTSFDKYLSKTGTDKTATTTTTDKTATNKAAADKPAVNTPPTTNLNPAAPGAKPAAQAGLGSLDVEGMTKTALDTAAKQPNPFAKDVTDIGAEKVAAKEAEVAGLKAIQDKYSDIFKGRKERLEKKEGDIETMKDQGLGLALLQAGAAMMTTRGGLGMAIGKGVDTGTKQYAAGLDKVRSAQEKLSDARDRLEEIEANRGEMSAREMLKAQNEVKTAGIGAREDLLKANMQMYNVNRETALKMVDNQVKVGIMQAEQAGALARTQMQVGAHRDTPDRLVFDQLVKANQGDAVKAAEALQKMKAEMFNMYEAYSKYLTGFAGKDTITPPLAFDQFASQFAIPTTKAPGKGATVLTQP
jgi:hypothetical protein